MQNIKIPIDDHKQSKYIRILFDSISATYDLLNILLSFGMSHYWRWKLVKIAELNEQDSVLDLCTGTGKIIFNFARFSQPKLLIGLDFSANMIRLANIKLARKKNKLINKKIFFFQADALRLPFSDNQFDIVSCAFGLRNIIQPDKYFLEKYRVCKPGGINISLELTRPVNFIIRFFYYSYLKIYLPFIGRTISRNTYAYDYLVKTITEFYSSNEIIDMMHKAGWQNIQVIPLTGSIITIYIGKKLV